MNAIIADDDELSLEILRNVLEQMGYGVALAHNGREVLDLLDQNSSHLVITDWDMPELNGLQLCHRIRRQDFNGYVYVIMVTAQDSPQCKIEGLQAGADAFLTKPLNPSELMVCLHTAERILSLETRDLAMFSLAKLAESRDPETGAHLERVQCYSRLLAQHLASQTKFLAAADAEFVRLIYQTSPLHDIGKVGIPDAILLKPGKLSTAEFAIMKTHTELGAGTLGAALDRFPNAKFLQMARDIALSHHEKYNGSGYPNGLVGDQIPLCARVVAVADVYDALTSRRVYKKPMPPMQARAAIIEERGRHFDPDVVAAFVTCQEEFLAIGQRLQDHTPELRATVAPAPPVAPAAATTPSSDALLVVEDDPEQLDFVRTMLEQMGHRVLAAADGQDALRVLSEQRPRLVISDWTMPGVDGLAMCRHIRAMTDLPYTYVILLTIHAGRRELAEAFQAGVDDFLAKPVRDVELSARIQTGLRALALRDELVQKYESSALLNAQLSRLNNRLESLATTDDLTGLYNRRHAMLRMEESWAAADRYQGDLAVIVIDVDNFKAINDTHGHSAGDAVLRQFAVVLQQSARSTDTVCRLGGDEFLVICPAETADEAAVCADRCRLTIGQFPFAVHERTIRLTISVGISGKRPEHRAFSDLLAEADRALYHVKHTGRNAIEVAGACGNAVSAAT